MRASYSFRPIREEDGELLFAIYAATRADEMALLDWSERQKQDFLRMQFSAQHQHYQAVFPDGRFDLILVDGEPVGRLYVHQTDEELRIVDIALLPQHRRKGLGGAILQELLEHARNAAKPVRIHVERNNPALHLYQRLGFTRISETGIYLLMEKPPTS